MVENDDGIRMIIFFTNHSFLVDSFHGGTMVNEVCYSNASHLNTGRSLSAF